MAKAPRTFTSADPRPRIHFRLRGNQPEVASIGCGPWTAVDDVIEGIDQVAGEDAHRLPCVIIWEGMSRA